VRGLEVLAGELYQEALMGGFNGQPPQGLAAALSALGWLPHAAAAANAADDEALRQLAVSITEAFRKTGLTPPLDWTTDLRGNIGGIQAAVVATSQTEAFMDAAILAPGAVICDSGRPSSVLDSIGDRREDVFVYEGGLMQLPEPIRFGAHNVLGFPEGINLACLSETMVLAMSGVDRSYSLGNRIPLSEAQTIYTRARQHGFAVSLPPVPGPHTGAHQALTNARVAP